MTPPSHPSPTTEPLSPGIDPRGPRLNAAFTAVVLAVVLLTAPTGPGLVLLALQTALFATGTIAGVQRTPFAWVFGALIRPRLGAPTHTEDPRPARFAQAVGFVFAAAGLAGYATGAPLLGAIAVGFALIAALLAATTGFCLGCELYVLGRRLARRSTTAPTTPLIPTTPTTPTPPTPTTKKDVFA